MQGAHPLNTLIPMFTNVEEAPAYLATTTEKVSTDSFYWASRMIAALADAHYAETIPDIERYQGLGAVHREQQDDEPILPVGRMRLLT